MKITKNYSFRYQMDHTLIFILVNGWGYMAFVLLMAVYRKAYLVYMLLVAQLMFGWLCFYFGTYYGDGIYKWCRYYYLRMKRRLNGRAIPNVKMNI